ncbi:hypothetical protein [Rhizobium sp. CC-YZS058]|nr:hypothetical protein [Rhizobium sp. CC-YZS058]MEA3533345.1 hypothetical protein [Rhizobium sp. CC-YZS058]
MDFTAPSSRTQLATIERLAGQSLRLATPEAIDARLVRWVETAFSAAA